MNPASSLRCFFKLLAEDSAMARLGAPRGWLLGMHYRGRWADRRHHAAPAESVTLNVRGRRLEMDLSASYEGSFIGVFLDNEYDCASLLQPPPKRILDLGANIGMGSLYLSALFPEAQFVCVEPDPRNVPLLEKNLRTNGVRAQVMVCAAGAKSGELNLRFGDNPTCSALETMPVYDRTKLTPVIVKTIPEILVSAGWDCAELVKMDVEGAEDELLSINSSWLRQVQAMLVEIHPNTTAQRIEAFLRPYGMNLRRLGSGREPVYFASRRPIGSSGAFCQSQV